MKKQLLLTLGLLLAVNPLFGQKADDPDFKRVSFKMGYSVIQHLEPQIYGQNVNSQVNAIQSGTLSGIETMNGVNLKLHYFFKNNMGVYMSADLANSSNSVFFENPEAPFVQYETSADFNSQCVGIASRFSTEKIPVNVILGTGIGRAGYNISYSYTENDVGQWYEGTYEILKFGMEVSVEYVVFKGLHLFSEINYSTNLDVDTDNIYLEYTSDNGDFYNIVYNNPSMAAVRLTLGLGYNF